jgi:hypothetical protein
MKNETKIWLRYAEGWDIGGYRDSAYFRLFAIITCFFKSLQNN